MGYKKLTVKEKEDYRKLLVNIGAFSNLFSDSKNVYLNYRIHENCYCRATNSDNLSRSDIAIDARKGTLGIGLKTFLRKNDNTIQKIAEFNKLSQELSGKSNEEIVSLIKKWRNDRLLTAKELYGLESLIYHCLIRDEKGYHIYEESMELIGEIRNISEKKNIITFISGKEKYSFNKSKSTLYKKFNTTNILDSYEIDLMEDPFKFLSQINIEGLVTERNSKEKVFLPLFSKQRKGEVPLKSGLNQWNGAGRGRKPNEVYIPIPAEIGRSKFFPNRDTLFKLHLPNKEILNAKVCQQGDKALMTNPNKDLGKWILRDVLNLKEHELVTRKILNEKGFDYLVVEKIDNTNYKIDVTTEQKSEYYN